MSSSTIRTELLTTLQGITGVPTIITEGENFKPKTNEDYPFTRFTFIPGESVQDDISTGSYKLTGRARIDLYYARSLDSADTARAMAETVVAAYPPEIVQLTGVQLTIDSCWFEGVRTESTSTNIPVFAFDTDQSHRSTCES